MADRAASLHSDSVEPEPESHQPDPNTRAPEPATSDRDRAAVERPADEREPASAGDATGRPTGRLPLRSGAIVAGLVLALVLGYALGRLGGSGTNTAASGGQQQAPNASTHTHAPGTAPHTHGGATATGTGADVTGLAVSASGFRLVPQTTTFPAGGVQTLRFRILGPDGAAVTSFSVEQTKQMHFIVVRRDLTGYQHLHPTLAADGTWTVPVALREPGVWRAYADFAVVGQGGAKTYATLGVDLTVTGALNPRPLPPPAHTAEVAGFQVTYAGTPQVGSTQPLLLNVARAGTPVPLERYLAAYGHLVVIREGDLGYVHVHPEDQLAGGAAKFWLAAPSSGRYRMFFDFQTAGTVHTAMFTLAVP